MERGVSVQPSLSLEVNGEVWSYQRGGTRIYSFGGVEINVWDHATGKPGIEFTPEAVEARVREWLKDEEEADAGDPEEEEEEVGYLPPPSHAGTVRVSDGHGCTERLPAWMDDPYGYGQ